MINSDYSPSLTAAIKVAQGMARQEKQSTYGVPHLVLAMLTESTGLSDILHSMQKDVAYLMEWFDTRREMYSSRKVIPVRLFRTMIWPGSLMKLNAPKSN